MRNTQPLTINVQPKVRKALLAVAVEQLTKVRQSVMLTNKIKQQPQQLLRLRLLRRRRLLPPSPPQVGLVIPSYFLLSSDSKN